MASTIGRAIVRIQISVAKTEHRLTCIGGAGETEILGDSVPRVQVLASKHIDGVQNGLIHRSL